MRLTRDEVAAIKLAAVNAFGPTAVVRLFGSRVDDNLRGGDVDLHVEADDDDHARQMQFVRELYKGIGERAIDVLVLRRGKSLNKFDHAAIRTGIVL